MGLQLSDITLTYPDGDSFLTALDGVELDVPNGHLTAVIGPSGSGKSSLLAVAAMLVTPDSGRLVVDGTDVADLDRHARTALRRTTVGVVFQQPNLLASLTATEQLQVMAHLDGTPPKAARKRAAELLDAVGLAGKAGRLPGQLSGGQQQRVNIARALMNDPSVLLVDEPTSALDRERSAAVIDLITTITHRRGTATVLVTHDRSQLGGADRVCEVVDGRLRDHHPTAEVVAPTENAPSAPVRAGTEVPAPGTRPGSYRPR
ncbi:putative ABC transport system ATP-binding protein [Prauserella isguenensis]|uniref:Putative ABC transport system ATP-binding protein n=1 Tax=Prauserella isguenensis TaxID=1470180 RepID=A0A839RZ06_9PSEU|nr:ABC transporter ATP-binding protein [Prauserella isguenensis]MBB3050828.1 putative ABC transport system ATP-binding protein [Prauserella isguenensis]